MRLNSTILVCIFSAAIIIGSGSAAKAIEKGVLYKFCKPFTDGAFEVSNANDVYCLAYFTAVADVANDSCGLYQKLLDPNSIQYPDENATEQLRVTKETHSANMDSETDLHAAIQDFVNKVAKEPKSWKYNSGWAVLQSLKTVAPCE